MSIQGTLSGKSYVLKFDAPGGTTDLSVHTTADITFLFLELPAGANWAADPRSQTGSGTLTVNGTTGGQLKLHLVPGQGNTGAAPLDVAGAYTCTGSTSA